MSFSCTLKSVTVGSRSSILSIKQTEEILRPLRSRYLETRFQIVTVRPLGDKHKDAPLLSMAKGMFVKEIELALLNGEISFAVHSTKDLTAVLPSGLKIGAFGERKDPRDALLNTWHLPFMELPSGARLGTSSPRRTAQLKAIRPDVEILPIRGNVDSRIEKMRSGDYDGVVLAVAGLQRMGRQDEISEYLAPDICTPEVGQGALAVQVRTGDDQIIDMVSTIDHSPTSTAVSAERAFLNTIGGGCKVPVAAYAQLDDHELRIRAMAGLPDGSRIFRIEQCYGSVDPESAGRLAAEALLATGAEEIISRDSDP